MDDKKEDKKEDKKTGYLYCLFNVMFLYHGKDVYKLGYCIDVESRLKGYTTSYIYSSEIKYKSEKIENVNLAETILFFKLERYRIVSNREFFNCNLEIIIKAIKEVENIIKNTSVDILKNDYNKPKKDIKNLIKQANDINEITEKNNIFEIRRFILKTKLKMKKITNEIIDDWYKKEYILDNILVFFNKQNNILIKNKIEYMEEILKLFCFKGMLDFETSVELTEELRKKIMESNFTNYNYYKDLMITFNKTIQKKSKENIKEVELRNLIKTLNSILYEFGIKIESAKQRKRNNKKQIWTFVYKLNTNIIYLEEILKNYDIP